MAELKLYNSLTHQKDVFKPIDENHIKMYVCGPTVHDRAHIGNARPVVVFDVLYRLLKHLYPQVTYVRNITDVDDKINAAAKERGIEISTLTKETTKLFQKDAQALNTLPPDVEPLATQHINDIIQIITILIEKNFAYVNDGHVLFCVDKYKNYGQLSRKKIDELIDGARVGQAPYKKKQGDFTLWKPSSDDLPGWDSPWGRGRPGWHIECSAMSYRYLGKQFDIHAGGIDLIFPHHENEIAQSCCAYNTSFMAKYWLHNGHLMAYGKKMSKSLGNFFTVHDLLQDHHGETIRLALLMTHYRQPFNWNQDTLLQAKQILDRLYTSIKDVEINQFDNSNIDLNNEMIAPLLDDLNTPLFITNLQHLASALNTHKKPELAKKLINAVQFLGILQEKPEIWFQTMHTKNLSKKDIENLIEKRTTARLEKRFNDSDSIRDELLKHGIVLEDTASGTTWRVQSFRS